MVPITGRIDEVLSRYPDLVKKDRILVLKQERDGEDVLAGMGFLGRYHYLEQALSRNLGVFSAAEQDRLMDCRVAIPGLGGVGGQHLITLSRTGIGRFSLAEFDTFEPVNTNRQYGARVSTFDRKKLQVMVEDALEINPYLEIRTFPEGVTPDNVDAFLDGVDLVADGMDFFNLEIRRLIFSRAREKSIPVITAGPLGFSAALLVFMPGQGKDFDTYFNIHDHLSPEDKLLRFFVGLAPRASQALYIDPAAISMAGKKGPSTGAGCLICSSVLAAEAVRVLLKKKGIRAAPHYFQYDPFARKFHTGYLPWGNRHPVQQFKLWQVKKKLKKALPLDLPKAPEGPDDPTRIISHLINAGCQAPSGDNCQPWAFEGKENRIDLYLRPGTDTSFFNFNQMASVMACGAAVENICQAATRYGLAAVPDLLPDPDNRKLLARIRLDPAELEESPLARFVWVRHTSRTRYSGRPLCDKDADRLEKSVRSFSGTSLDLIRDVKAIKALSGLIYQADLIRTQRRDLHTHLMKMIRFTREEALLTRDGLPLKNLEAGTAGEAFLKRCRPWPAMALANRLGGGNLIAKIAAKGARQSSALGLIRVRGADRAAWMTGGRAMERVWLAATAAGLSFQPMTAITFFRARWDAGCQADFSMAHQQRLGRLWPLFDHYFPCRPDETPVMLFRLGFGRPVSCRTLRGYHGNLGR
jgi:molybdopterin/thiamine biosynthesis adenylyltransferase/nitroreductase